MHVVFALCLALAQVPTAPADDATAPPPAEETGPVVVCARSQTACATGCVPLGEACPSASELSPTPVATPTAGEVGDASEVREFSRGRQSRAARDNAQWEPVTEWKLRRLRVGVLLGIPAAALLAPPLYMALSTGFDGYPTRIKGAAAAFGVTGGLLLLAAIIAPNVMARRRLDLSASGIAVRF